MLLIGVVGVAGAVGVALLLALLGNARFSWFCPKTISCLVCLSHQYLASCLIAGVEVNQLHDKFYRKYEVYSMAWSRIDLSTMMIAGAPSGGPIGAHSPNSVALGV